MTARPVNETPEERDELASEYVLGTLSAERRNEVQQRLGDEPQLQAAVDAWERRLLGLTDLVEPHAPSPHLWRRIERSVNDLSRPAAATAFWWNLLPLWRGLAGAGLAASLVLGALLLTQATVKPTYLVVLVAPQDQGAGLGDQASNPRKSS